MDRKLPTTSGGIRTALWLILAGSVVILITTAAVPVVGDFWDDQNDAAQIAVIDGDRGQFIVAFGLQGLGVVAVGVGFLLLGLAIAPMEAAHGRRRGIAARSAGWLGLLVAAGGVSRLLHAVFATPEFYVDSVIDDVVVVIAGIALLVSMVTFGVLAWSAPPPKWTAVVLVVGGLLNIIPDLAYVALTVFTIANLIVMRRRASDATADEWELPERTAAS